MKYNYSS